jgi:hypothetical protein
MEMDVSFSYTDLSNLSSFILEGILTVLIAISSFWLIYDHPSSAKFLTETERQIVMDRVYSDRNRGIRSAAEAAEKDSVKWSDVKAAIFDWQTPFHVLAYWGVVSISHKKYKMANRRRLALFMASDSSFLASLPAWDTLQRLHSS